MAPLLTRLSQSFGFGASGVTAAPGKFEATGGSTVEAGGYKYHIFVNPNSPESLVVSSGTATVSYVCVAGGGGGGSGWTGNGSNHWGGGGGGGGGMLTGNAPITPSPGTYAVVTGAGGEGNATAWTGNPNNASGLKIGNKGETSSIAFPSAVTSIGGGGGENRSGRVNGSSPEPATFDNMSGGSGGGSCSTPWPQNTGGEGTSGQGNDGGLGDGGDTAGGGGGGAGSAGQNAQTTPHVGGDGGTSSPSGFPGPGLLPSPVLTPGWANAVGPNGDMCSGGGGGSAQNNSPYGEGGEAGGEGAGDGAGQEGTCTNAAGGDAVDNTGCGGGGGAACDAGPGPGANHRGGNGGDGIVILKYPY